MKKKSTFHLILMIAGIFHIIAFFALPYLKVQTDLDDLALAILGSREGLPENWTGFVMARISLASGSDGVPMLLILAAILVFAIVILVMNAVLNRKLSYILTIVLSVISAGGYLIMHLGCVEIGATPFVSAQLTGVVLAVLCVVQIVVAILGLTKDKTGVGVRGAAPIGNVPPQGAVPGPGAVHAPVGAGRAPGMPGAGGTPGAGRAPGMPGAGGTPGAGRAPGAPGAGGTPGAARVAGAAGAAAGAAVQGAVRTGSLIGVSGGDYDGARIPLGDGIYLGVGRDPAVSSLIIPGEGVSRLHCRIRYNSGSNTYTIVDSSTNGTYTADGARLKKDMETTVAPGTTIRIGNSGYTFQLG